MRQMRVPTRNELDTWVMGFVELRPRGQGWILKSPARVFLVFNDIWGKLCPEGRSSKKLFSLNIFSVSLLPPTKEHPNRPMESTGGYRILRRLFMEPSWNALRVKQLSGLTTGMLFRPLRLIMPAVRLWDVIVSCIWPSIPGMSRRLRLLIWSTPARWGTGHRAWHPWAHTQIHCHLELKRTLEFVKCNPLHISDTTAQAETFGYHLASSKMESYLFCILYIHTVAART